MTIQTKIHQAKQLTRHELVSMPDQHDASQQTHTKRPKRPQVRRLSSTRIEVKFSRPAELRVSLPSMAQEPESAKYMLRVLTSAMEPRFEPGEMLIVNRDAEVSVGNFVVIAVEPSDSGKIGRLTAQSDESVTYQQLNPVRSFTIERQFIKHIHRIDGCYTPL